MLQPAVDTSALVELIKRDPDKLADFLKQNPGVAQTLLGLYQKQSEALESDFATALISCLAAPAFPEEFEKVFKPPHTPSRLERGPEHVEIISIEGKSLTLVKPSLFYASDCDLGLGLFCRVDLEPGDIWWLNDLNDKRFTRQLINLQNLNQMNPHEQAHAQKYGYIDIPSRKIVMCTSPFGLVNHANKQNANSDSDEYGNSIATKPIRAGEEIRIGYEYDAMLSIIWKFSAIANLLSQQQLASEEFLLSPASAHPETVAFLDML